MWRGGPHPGVGHKSVAIEHLFAFELVYKFFGDFISSAFSFCFMHWFSFELIEFFFCLFVDVVEHLQFI
jgi:hypothetical protein